MGWSLSDIFVNADAVGKVAQHVPEAAEKAGKSINQVLDGITNAGSKHHEISATNKTAQHAAEMDAVSKMDEGKIRTYFQEKAQYEKSTSSVGQIATALTPWPIRVINKLNPFS
jgi:hypothetical protein